MSDIAEWGRIRAPSRDQSREGHPIQARSSGVHSERTREADQHGFALGCGFLFVKAHYFRVARLSPAEVSSVPTGPFCQPSFSTQKRGQLRVAALSSSVARRPLCDTIHNWAPQIPPAEHFF
jgi:hypothetical protein